ncbi:TipA [Balamuthia mandrillaris]
MEGEHAGRQRLSDMISRPTPGSSHLPQTTEGNLNSSSPSSTTATSSSSSKNSGSTIGGKGGGSGGVGSHSDSHIRTVKPSSSANNNKKATSSSTSRNHREFEEGLTKPKRRHQRDSGLIDFEKLLAMESSAAPHKVDKKKSSSSSSSSSSAAASSSSHSRPFIPFVWGTSKKNKPKRADKHHTNTSAPPPEREEEGGEAEGRNNLPHPPQPTHRLPVSHSARLVAMEGNRPPSNPTTTERKRLSAEQLDRLSKRKIQVLKKMTIRMSVGGRMGKLIALQQPKFTDWIELPGFPTRPLTSTGKFFELRAPANDLQDVVLSFGNVAAGRSINLYPMLPGTSVRLADPICDYFRCKIYENRVVAALADGCGWGNGPAEAARRAAHAFVSFFEERHHTINDLREAGRLILRALAKAHEKIISGYDIRDMGNVGTTTICGGLLLELISKTQISHSMRNLGEGIKDLKRVRSRTAKRSTPVSIAELAGLVDCSPSDDERAELEAIDPTTPRRPASASAELAQLIEEELRKKEKEAAAEEAHMQKKQDRTIWQNEYQHRNWVFVCATVGDCKAFHYSQKNKEIIDVTHNNRLNQVDATDPGGRLGPYRGYAGDKEPDLRNLGLYFVPCQQDDVIFLVSDGIYDNFDPQHHGLLPVDLGLRGSTWDEAQLLDFAGVERAKTDWMTSKMMEVLTNGRVKKKRHIRPTTPLVRAGIRNNNQQQTYYASLSGGISQQKENKAFVREADIIAKLERLEAAIDQEESEATKADLLQELEELLDTIDAEDFGDDEDAENGESEEAQSEDDDDENKREVKEQNDDVNEKQKEKEVIEDATTSAATEQEGTKQSESIENGSTQDKKQKEKEKEKEEPEFDTMLSPWYIVTKLTQACRKIVQPSVDFMQQNPHARMPSDDYANYPGKMDHTTCLAFRVGFNQFSTMLDPNRCSPYPSFASTTPPVTTTSESSSPRPKQSQNLTRSVSYPHESSPPTAASTASASSAELQKTDSYYGYAFPGSEQKVTDDPISLSAFLLGSQTEEKDDKQQAASTFGQVITPSPSTDVQMEKTEEERVKVQSGTTIIPSKRTTMARQSLHRRSRSFCAAEVRALVTSSSSSNSGGWTRVEPSQTLCIPDIRQKINFFLELENNRNNKSSFFSTSSNSFSIRDRQHTTFRKTEARIDPSTTQKVQRIQLQELRRNGEEEDSEGEEEQMRSKTSRTSKSNRDEWRRSKTPRDMNSVAKRQRWIDNIQQEEPDSSSSIGTRRKEQGFESSETETESDKTGTGTTTGTGTGTDMTGMEMSESETPEMSETDTETEPEAEMEKQKEKGMGGRRTLFSLAESQPLKTQRWKNSIRNSEAEEKEAEEENKTPTRRRSVDLPLSSSQENLQLQQRQQQKAEEEEQNRRKQKEKELAEQEEDETKKQNEEKKSGKSKIAYWQKKGSKINQGMKKVRSFTSQRPAAVVSSSTPSLQSPTPTPNSNNTKQKSNKKQSKTKRPTSLCQITSPLASSSSPSFSSARNNNEEDILKREEREELEYLRELLRRRTAASNDKEEQHIRTKANESEGTETDEEGEEDTIQTKLSITPKEVKVECWFEGKRRSTKEETEEEQTRTIIECKAFPATLVLVCKEQQHQPAEEQTHPQGKPPPQQQRVNRFKGGSKQIGFGRSELSKLLPDLLEEARQSTPPPSHPHTPTTQTTTKKRTTRNVILPDRVEVDPASMVMVTSEQLVSSAPPRSRGKLFTFTFSRRTTTSLNRF